MKLIEITSVIEQSQMVLFGAFYPIDAELVEDINKKTKTIVLIGNAGPKMWTNFVKLSSKGITRAGSKKLGLMDQWTYEVVNKMAEKLGCQAVYPFSGPPYYPFQKWALRTTDVWESPIALSIHKKFGLWHAYRAALCFSEKIDFTAPKKRDSPCIACEKKPCLTSCPVGAFSEQGFDAFACRNHISSKKGSQCCNGGCLARLACPIGVNYVYSKPQIKFHMKEFVKNFQVC